MSVENGMLYAPVEEYGSQREVNRLALNMLPVAQTLFDRSGLDPSIELIQEPAAMAVAGAAFGFTVYLFERILSSKLSPKAAGQYVLDEAYGRGRWNPILYPAVSAAAFTLISLGIRFYPTLVQILDSTP